MYNHVKLTNMKPALNCVHFLEEYHIHFKMFIFLKSCHLIFDSIGKVHLIFHFTIVQKSKSIQRSDSNQIILNKAFFL